MGDRSVDARDISRGVVVTGDGNNVALTFGDTGIRLPLRRKQFPPPDRRRQPRAGDPPRELDILVAEAEKLPLVGRQDLLAELRAWLDDEVEISVYALIGRAGTGKTRLAIEFCKTIDSDPAAKGEWLAGFLSPADLTPVVEALTTRSFAWERKTLLVIDYAAQCHQALAHWLDRLAEQKLDTKLRFLLLDREAPEAFGWWRDLTVLGPPSRRDLFRELHPRQLPDLSDLEERRALMAAALQASRGLRPGAPDATPIPAKDVDGDFDRRLEGPQFGNPLNLVMAGLIAIDRGPRAALALRRLDAARHIARRELRRFSDLARSRQIGEDEIRHIVAFNGLAGGLPIADLRKAVADELAASRRSIDRLDALLTLLQQELPSHSGAPDQRRIATIQPDLIGEAAIVEAFTGEPSREAEAAEVLRRAYALDGTAAAQALFRVVQDFAHPIEDPDAADEEKAMGRRIMDWMLNLAERIEDPEQLAPLAAALPEKTTILREPAAQLTRVLADYFVEKAKGSDDPFSVNYSAILLNNLSIRLSALGRREEALGASEEAVGHYRELAAVRPDAFTPDLATSLNNLANALSDLGRREEALGAAEEAVGYFRALAAALRDAFNPNLALSLNNLSTKLGALGRREEALGAAEEAVRLHRALAANRPDVFTPDLAGSLNNLANGLGDLRRHEEALGAAEEAVGLSRGLAASRPDAFLPDLARSLSNLAIVLGDLGRREEALKTAEEAVGLRRVLAEARPDAFTPDLAVSLNNLANKLSALGRREAALGMAEEAVGHYRALATARPDAFTPGLASSLNNLANRLSDLGRREEALGAAEEAVGHYRALAAVRPDAFTPNLAKSLNDSSPMLSALGRREEALGAAEEAVRHYRALATARPDAFTADLAISLNNLGIILSALGRRAAALSAAEEAVGHYRALAAARPDAFTADLAMSLNNLAIMLSALRRSEEALGAAEEAVGHYRALAAARPDTFNDRLARSLKVLGDLQGDAGKPDLAAGTLAEAIRHLSPSFLRVPQAVAGLMARIAQSYLARCEAARGQPDAELLAPVSEVFKKLQQQEAEK